MKLDELDYALPEDRIARHPLPERAASRLLVVAESLEHGAVRDLPGRLEPGTVVVVNDTRVLKARLFGRKQGSEGKVELLLVRMQDDGRWQAMARSSKPMRVGTRVNIDAGQSMVVAHVESERDAEGLLTVRIESDEPIFALLERVGHVPLPPYLGRGDEPADDDRYQTIFASVPGAVAAPTAGLHFDEALLAALRDRGCELAKVTLHVGPGTFRPVTADDLDHHPMHSEWFEIPAETAATIAAARRGGSRVLAIGTTVVRALESAASAAEPGCVAVTSGETRLLIQPGYRFKVVDQLVTNFHLPRSTLLALVFAFGGTDRVREAYATAIREGYRFYSYGDAMFLASCASRGAR
ncbi:MAG: tRNA preQ1(34) S-adenosylmethionine ribosyltransferase-isomerase QueA [Deltaproteobacteria bacterium]|nr:tRNA preQ1(34) S-adenosylmethionine ribosyltransferase-isomerase QueA [Deltaproteobacteria bacterium]